MTEATRFKLAVGVLIGSPIIGLLKVFFPTYPILEVYGILTLVVGGYFGSKTITDNAYTKANGIVNNEPK